MLKINIMKTVKLILASVVLLATTALFAQNMSADLSKSKIKWNGKKVGGEHWGYINLKSGNFNIEGEKIVSGTFIIDMSSIVCKDLESPEYNKKLVDHLKSDDFFGVDTYPEATLEITESTKFVDGKATVKGDLTIKENTHPVKFSATKTGNKYMATITVDRSKYDVRYGSKSFFDNLGDNFIHDEFTLDVELVVK